MTRSARRAMPCVVAAAALALVWSARPSPAQQNPLGNAAPAATPMPGGTLSVEALGDALTPYGKNATTTNGHTDYSINVTKGKWTINLIVSESPNGQVIWMTNNLSALPPQADATALLNVLRKNTEIGPMFFSVAGDSLRLSDPVPNANLNAAGLQARIDDMVTTIVNTESLWTTDALAGKRAG